MEKITLTPKEKAEELLNKMLKNTTILVGSRVIAKEQALIAAEEVYKEASNKHFIIGRNGLSSKEYWQEVKNQIQKL